MSARFIAAIVGAVGGLIVGATVVAPQLTPALDAARNVSKATPKPDNDSELPQRQTSVYGLETTIWRVVSAIPRSLPVPALISSGLEQDLTRLSDGTFQAVVSDPGHLVPLQETLSALSSGVIDAVLTPPGLAAIGATADHPAAIQLFAGHPFGPSALEMLVWMRAGGGLERLNSLYESSGIYVIPCGMSAAASGGWFTHSIQSPDDFQGRNIRASGFSFQVLEHLGAEAMDLNDAETTLTFAADGLDGAIISSPNADRRLSIEQYASNLYFPAWQSPASLLVLAMNSDQWKNLSPRSQTVLRGLCGDMMLATLGRSEAAQYEALKSLIAQDIEVDTYPTPVLTALKSAWQAVTEKLASDDRSFRAVWDELAEFRENYRVWNDIRTGDGTVIQN